MAQFPINDDQSLQDAVNYLLSGPSGLGQYFAGFSASGVSLSYLTGNYRTPFTSDVLVQTYVAPITVNTVSMIDSRTIVITFSGYGGSTPPFELGQGITASGISGNYDSIINNLGYQVGVVQCTTTSVTIRLRNDYPLQSPGSGGTVTLSIVGDFLNSTDCNARVIVTGGTDRVFISGQLDNTITYQVTSGPADLQYNVQVNRYVGFLNSDPTNPDYLFNFDATVAQKQYTYTGLTGTNTMPVIETVFSTLIDQPSPNYYWYILEVEFQATSGSIEIDNSAFGLRSLSAQVVKQ